MDFSDVTIQELVQMCKLVESKNTKEFFLTNIAQKLRTENFRSLDQTMRQDMKIIFSQLRNNDLMTLFERIFQPDTKPVIKVNDVQQQGPNLSEINQGTFIPVSNEPPSNLTLVPISNVPPSNLTLIPINKDPPSNLTLVPIRKYAPTDIKVKLEVEISDSLTSKNTRGQTEKLNQGVEGNPEFNQICRKRSANEEPQTSSSVGNCSEKSASTTYKNIKIINSICIVNNKFNVESSVTIFKFKNVPGDITSLSNYLKQAYEEILSFITRKALPHHKIGMKILLTNSKPININFTDAFKLTSDIIAYFFDSVAQSNSNFFLTDTLEVTTVIIKVPYGKGRISPGGLSSLNIIRRKYKSIVNIPVDEPIYCLPIAILIGKCIAEKQMNKLQMYRKTRIRLMEDVHFLNKLAGVTISKDFGASVVQLQLYQKVLPLYNIVVFNSTQSYKDKLFNGENKDGRAINIFYFQDISHFVAIRDVRLFFGKRFQCQVCFALYDATNSHLCVEKCKCCETSPLCNRQQKKIVCDDCNRSFYGRKCFTNHQTNSICSVVRLCNLCSKLIDTRQTNYTEHICEENKCSDCLNTVGNKHHVCYIKKYTEKPHHDFSIIFYDLKYIQNLNNTNEMYVQEPNSCVLHIVCNKCFMIPNAEYNCLVCVKRQHIFENSLVGNCVKKFIDFCESFRNHYPVFCITHNFKTYDQQFILQELTKRDKSINPIMGDKKIYKIIYKSYINFIDSFNFLPIPLSKFPEIFDLKIVEKDWYPHLFNTSENYNYIGNVPDRKYFGTSDMSDKEFLRFNVWYANRISSGLKYNNREELYKHYVHNVDVLRNGCIAFMTNFYNITGVNPLLQSFTLGEAIMHAFRKNFLQKGTLGILPSNLYHNSKKSRSPSRLKWLVYENRKCVGDILYNVKIPKTKFYVDGYCKLTNTVYEFLQCYQHGCKNCFLNRGHHINGSKSDTFDTRYDETIVNLEFIASLDYKIRKIWECEFNQFLNENPKIAKCLENDPEVLPNFLNPRDALYGGRTETFRLYYKAKQDEKIRFYNFKSLYPYVSKTEKNPIYHPKIYYKDDCKNLDISNMDGFIKCSILPPRYLLIPVLPSKIQNNIIFPLCRTCAENEIIITKCTHTDSERMLIGTWVLDEVKLAVNNRYEIQEIFEIWQYEVSQYIENVKTGGIFTEYINCFLKLKQEASDWPANITSKSKKAKYVKEFLSHEGIELDSKAIKNNPSQRAFIDLALDSLFENFFDTSGRSESAIICSTLELYALISSPGIVVTDILPGENVLWASWNYSADGVAEQLEHVSLAIGVFTEANARIKLYSELTKISHNILYCDTDSIIFVEDINNKGFLKTGDFIGDLTDEISVIGKNAYITEFVSTGPKSYAYIVFEPDLDVFLQIVKHNGVTLNIESKNVINIATLKSIVNVDDDEGFRVVNDTNKNKRKKIINVDSKPMSKKSGITFTKRVCLEEFKTVPFGFQ